MILEGADQVAVVGRGRGVWWDPGMEGDLVGDFMVCPLVWNAGEVRRESLGERLRSGGPPSVHTASTVDDDRMEGNPRRDASL